MRIIMSVHFITISFLRKIRLPAASLIIIRFIRAVARHFSIRFGIILVV